MAVKFLIGAVTAIAAAIAFAPQASAQAVGAQARFAVLNVGDVDKTLKFYSGLGFVEAGRFGGKTDFEVILQSRPGPVDWKDDAGILVLNVSPKHKAPMERGNSYNRIGMSVANLARALEQVRATGGEVLSGPTRIAAAKMQIAMVQDPEGHRIELIQGE